MGWCTRAFPNARGYDLRACSSRSVKMPSVVVSLIVPDSPIAGRLGSLPSNLRGPEPAGGESRLETAAKEAHR